MTGYKAWMLAAAMMAAGVALPQAANAKDAATCGSGMVCASTPQTVVAAMKKAGWKADFGTDGVGDPKIESTLLGYNFTVLFYGCEDHKQCDSLQFYIGFEDDGKNTPALANNWNKNKRFLQMAALDDGSLRVSYDVSTIGGINQANFADDLDWWQTMLGELATFFKKG